MSRYTLENDKIRIGVESFGAELKSLQDKATGREYMWNADPAFWKRTSPILFPLVGSLQGKAYRYQDKEYPMSQHGFARDREFTLIKKESAEIWFELTEDEKTWEIYPFAFKLRIGYVLVDRKVEVHWQVENTDLHTLYFSIGGHPAFMCPIKEGTVQTDYAIRLDTQDEITSTMIGRDGLASDRKKKYLLDKGVLAVTEDLFDEDALIVEHDQAHEVALLDPEKKPYLTVRFEAPLFGIWSPPKKNAPFICIEPWYGRCDGENFHGTLEEREWGNQLEPGKLFRTKYEIEI